jgi:DNA-binding GntR family transcriptional regulator
LNLPAEGKAQAIVKDHRTILQALERRDPAAADAALRQHLAGTLSFVQDIRARYPEWIS